MNLIVLKQIRDENERVNLLWDVHAVFAGSASFARMHGRNAVNHARALRECVVKMSESCWTRYGGNFLWDINLRGLVELYEIVTIKKICLFAL